MSCRQTKSGQERWLCDESHGSDGDFDVDVKPVFPKDGLISGSLYPADVSGRLERTPAATEEVKQAKSQRCKSRISGWNYNAEAGSAATEA